MYGILADFSMNNKCQLVGLFDGRLMADFAQRRRAKSPPVSYQTGHKSTVEHIKLASPDIIPILTQIINQTCAEQRIPTLFKTGVTTPVPKPDKPPKDTNSHR